MAMQHELSEEWAAKKARISYEIVMGLVKARDIKISFPVFEEVGDETMAAINEAVREVLCQHQQEVVIDCLKQFAIGLPKLVAPHK